MALVACGADDVVEDAADAVGDVAEDAVDAAGDAVDAAGDAMDDMMHSVDQAIYGDLDAIELDGTNVTFWHRFESGARQEVIASMVDEFNSSNEYGITVEEVAIGNYDVIYDSMVNALTTGDLPGLVIAYQNQAAAYQVADGLVSVEPYITHPEYGLTADESEDFFQAFIETDRLPQFNGEAYGFPPNRSMEMMYYNSDWLTELGYDAPPATPDEFAEMVCAARDQAFSKNEGDVTAGTQVGTGASNFASLVFARGGDVFADGQYTYNTPEAVEAMELMAQLAADGCILPIAEQYGDQSDFGKGIILFTQGSSSGMPFYESAVNEGADFAWSVAPIPYTGADPVQNIYGASASIPKTDPATQLAAWLFLKHWTEPTQQAEWAQATNYFPVRNSVADGLDGYFEENPAYQVAFDLLPFGKGEPPVAGYDEVRDEVAQAMSAIIFDGADAAETLSALDAVANGLLADAAP